MDSCENFDSISDAYNDSAFDGEAYMDESARSRRMARRRAQARALAGRRQQLEANRPQQTRNVRDAFNRVGSDIQKVDLENKVNSDMLEALLKLQGDRITGTETSSAVSKIWDQVKEEFPQLTDNPVLKTLLPFAPLLFLKPDKKGNGIGGVLQDPRVWGPIVAGVLAYMTNNKKSEAKEIVIKPDSYEFQDNTPEKTFDLLYNVYDSQGRVMTAEVEWSSSNPDQLSVDSSGKITSKRPGIDTTNWITATVKGTSVKDKIEVTIPA